jgi:opacity protein-like surface antigen
MRQAGVPFGSLAILISCLIAPPLAAAQPPERGPRVGGIVSGSFGDGGPAPVIGIAGGYRFTPRLRLEVDASYMPGLDFGDFPACPPARFCVAATVPAEAILGGSFSLKGRAAMLSVNVVSELPVRARWIRPYVVTGAGVAEVRREQRHANLPLRFTRTSTGPLLTMGGGVDFLVTRRVGIGVDLRYQHVFEEDQFGRSDMDQSLTVARLGSSVSYRF